VTGSAASDKPAARTRLMTGLRMAGPSLLTVYPFDRVRGQSSRGAMTAVASVVKLGDIATHLARKRS